MRLLLAGLCLLASFLAVPAFAAANPAGVWLFDRAPSYPGVTMMQVSVDGASVRGAVTTKWYGPIAMENAVRRGDTIGFDVRNLNDKRHPTRHWTARFSDSGVTLTGDFWSSHLVQRGRRGSAAEGERRGFVVAADPPPLAALAPDGLAATPPMGWSSWNKFADRIDDATIRAMADAMVATGLRDAGYRYVNIDDGWQGRRGADGALHPNARFPDMKALADYIHARGLKLGLYSSPGPRTCAGYEGSYGHVAQDARTFAAWGVDYLKYDLCSGEWFYADADGVKRVYAEMGRALRATGRPIIYSLCEYGRFDVAVWGRSVGGHLWRTTGDITDDYATMADIGFARNPRFPHDGPGGWNDPDMLEVGNGGMSDDEYRTHLTLWAMQAAPLVMGHDLRRTSPAAQAMLTNRGVIAIDQDALGRQGHAVRKQGEVDVWRKDLAGGAVALALFNRGTAAAALSVDPRDAGMTRVAAVRDLWKGAPVAPGTSGFTVPPHGVVLLRVEGAAAPTS
jgi:alpha-galactosidase